MNPKSGVSSPFYKGGLRGICFCRHSRGGGNPNKIQSRRGLPGGRSLSLVSPRESNQREGDPGAPVLRTFLRYSTGRAAAQLAPAGLRQCSRNSPFRSAFLGGRTWALNSNPNATLIPTLLPEGEGLMLAFI